MLYCGIDEAGYGPMLGPMCSGLAAFDVEGEEAAVDLWQRLGPSVCRDLKSWRSGGGAAIAVGDSKKLKLPNASKSRHPLFHLERGVLAFLRAGGDRVASDADLLTGLGVVLGGDPWFGGEDAALPLACDAAGLGIASNQLTAAMERSGVRLAGVRCVALEPRGYNELVGRTRTKASAAAWGIAQQLRWVREAARSGPQGGPVRVVCDRLSGRTRYAGVLLRAFDESSEDASVEVVREDDAQSVYRVVGDRLGDDFRVLFMSEAEGAHLPVALASMAAKLCRELAMARLNRYFGERARGAGVELKPTAGYVQDARRWLEDCRPLLSDDERRALIRVV
ncbi:MAG: hypothetical protein AAF108_00585 [Planctomycetota bacterium]